MMNSLCPNSVTPWSPCWHLLYRLHVGIFSTTNGNSCAVLAQHYQFVLHLHLPGVTVRCRERTQDVASVRASGMQPLVLVEVQSVLGDEMDPLNLVDGRESTSSCQNVGYFLQA